MDMRGGAFFGLRGDDQCLGVGAQPWDRLEDNGMGLDVAVAVSAFVCGDVSVSVVADRDSTDCVEFVFGSMRGSDGGFVGANGFVVSA